MGPDMTDIMRNTTGEKKIWDTFFGGQQGASSSWDHLKLITHMWCVGI